MIAFLLGVPGKLATLLSRLSAARATKLDNLDAAISTTAPASTALTIATWTDALAAALLARKQRVPTSVVGSGNTVFTLPDYSTTAVIGALAAFSGATTANTLKTVLSVTGAGMLNFIGVVAIDATSRTLRIKVSLDGTVVVDTTSAAVAFARAGIAPVGGLAGYYDGTYNQASVIPAKLPFNTSLLIEFASSLSETNKVRFITAHEVH